MKQKILFERDTVYRTPGLQNKLYSWSRRHNITFVENNEVDGVTISFGLKSDLLIFLLTWPQDYPQPRVV